MTAALFACLGLAATAAPTPAGAQQDVPRSTMAGVTFPQPAQIWFPDPRRTQATAINDAAAAAGKGCTTYEFSIWYVTAPAAAEDIRVRTDAAFTEAGWALELAMVPTAEERAYLARRATDELVMAWIIRAEEVGLLLCVAGPAAAPLDEGAGGALQVDDIRAEDGTPLPRPRPEPGEIAASPAALVPAPVDAVAPAAVDGLPLPPPATPDAAVPGGIAGLIEGAAPATPDPTPAPTVATPPATEAAAAAADAGSGISLGLLVLAAALAGAAFLLIRVGLAGLGSRAGGRWPTAIATVVYSQVASEERKSKGGKDTTRYVPVVAYEYDVEGTLYRAARLRFGDTSSAELNEAKRTTDRYPVGAGIEVRFNPARPAEAVVETSHDRLEVPLIAGVAVGVLAVASLISAVA